jgi:hypothetical protein
MSVRATLPLLSFLLVLGLTIATAGRAYAQVSSSVQIEALAITATTLKITGKNFGSGTPTVLVGDSTAAVSSSSDTEIVVETPALSAGTHIVKVVRDASEGGSALSTLRIR